MDSMWEFTRGLNTYPNNPLNPYAEYDADRYTAIGLMWDEYMDLAVGWRKKYPNNFMLIEMDRALNDEVSQRCMLGFAGYTDPVIETGIKEKARQ